MDVFSGLGGVLFEKNRLNGHNRPTGSTLTGRLNGSAEEKPEGTTQKTG